LHSGDDVAAGGPAGRGDAGEKAGRDSQEDSEGDRTEGDDEFRVEADQGAGDTVVTVGLVQSEAKSGDAPEPG